MRLAVLNSGVFTQEELQDRFADLVNKILFWTELELNLPMGKATTIMTKTGGEETIPTLKFRAGILMNIDLLREELEEIRPFLWRWSVEDGNVTE